jgi:putative FmdB family regulatory protein
MPIYEYRCDQGHTFEVMQRMSDGPLGSCQTCSAPVQRVFHPVAVHFKGSGFYNTDYGTRKRAREKGAESSDGAKSTDSKDASSTTNTESKPATTDSTASKPKAAASD